MEPRDDFILMLLVSVFTGGDVDVTTERIAFSERRACVAAAEALERRSGAVSVNGVEFVTRYSAVCVGADSGAVLAPPN